MPDPSQTTAIKEGLALRDRLIEAKAQVDDRIRDGLAPGVDMTDFKDTDYLDMV